MSILTNIDKVAFSSKFSIDKVIGTYPQISITATASNTATGTISGLGYSSGNSMFLAIASLDGVNYAPLDADFGSVYVVGKINNGVFTATVSNQSASTVTAYIILCTIARSDQGAINPQNIDNLFANRKQPLLDSRKDYLTIASEGIYPFTTAVHTTTTVTIPHSLGFVPQAFVQYENLNNGDMLNICSDANTIGLTSVPILSYAYTDSNNLYVFTNGSSLSFNLNIHFKLYYDH